MGVVIVDRLEVVEIEHQGCDLKILPAEAFPEDLVELIAVVHTRELVDVDTLVLKRDRYCRERYRKADGKQRDAVDLHLYRVADEDRQEEADNGEVAKGRILDLVDDVVRIAVDDQAETDKDEHQIIRASVILIVPVNAEYDRNEEIDYEHRCFNDDKAPEDDDVPAFGLAVDVLDDEIDDAYADDQVVQVQIGVAHHQYPIVHGTFHAVTGENIDVCYTVEDGYDEEACDDAALFFTRREIPASRSQDAEENGNSDQVGNIYGL